MNQAADIMTKHLEKLFIGLQPSPEVFFSQQKSVAFYQLKTAMLYPESMTVIVAQPNPPVRRASYRIN
jgi:hypothetical protein